MKASFKIKSDYRLIQHKSAKDKNKMFVMYSLYMVLTSRENLNVHTSVWLQVSANYIVWQQLSASTLVGRKVTLEVAELLVRNIWYFRNCWSSGILPTQPSLKLARYLRENPLLMPAVTGA